VRPEWDGGVLAVGDILGGEIPVRTVSPAAAVLNLKIRTIKKMAYDNRNREYFKTAIFSHCGGLQLYRHFGFQRGVTVASRSQLGLPA